jgi:hypothetical protein
MVLTNSFLAERLAIVVLLLSFAVHLSSAGADLANGLGDHIEWVEWRQAVDKANQEDKPLMVSPDYAEMIVVATTYLEL